MSVIEKSSERYIGYEYMEIKADSRKVSMYIDESNDTAALL